MKKVLCVLGSAIYSCGISFLVCLFITWFSEVKIPVNLHIFLAVALIIVFVFLGYLLSYPLAMMAEVTKGCVFISFLPYFYCMCFSAIEPWTHIEPWSFFTVLLEGNRTAFSILVDIAIVTFFFIQWVMIASKAKIMLGYVNNPVCSTNFVRGFNFVVFISVVLRGFAYCFKELKELPLTMFSVAGIIVFLTPFITTLMQNELKSEMKEGYVFSFNEESNEGRERKQKYIDRYSGICRIFLGLLIISIAVGIFASVEECTSGLGTTLGSTEMAWIVPPYFIFNIINIPALWMHDEEGRWP